MTRHRNTHELPLASRSVPCGPGDDPVADAEIHSVVDRFYVLVRADDLLGPIFEEWVADWPKHLSIMEDFWSSAIHRTGRYSGRPLDVHRKIPNLQHAQFDRWLKLWSQAVNETVRPEYRDPMTTMARRMSDAMSFRLIGAN